MRAEQLLRNCFRDTFRKPCAFFRIADQAACEGISFRTSFRKASAFFRNADQTENCRKCVVPAESGLLLHVCFFSVWGFLKHLIYKDNNETAHSLMSQIKSVL